MHSLYCSLWGRIGLSLSFSFPLCVGREEFSGIIGRTDTSSSLKHSGGFISIGCWRYSFMVDSPLSLGTVSVLGATATRPGALLDACGLGQLSFIIVVLAFYQSMGNHALWMAFPLDLSCTWRYAMGTLAVKKIRREPVTDPRLILS